MPTGLIGCGNPAMTFYTDFGNRLSARVSIVEPSITGQTNQPVPLCDLPAAVASQLLPHFLHSIDNTLHSAVSVDSTTAPFRENALGVRHDRRCFNVARSRRTRLDRCRLRWCLFVTGRKIEHRCGPIFAVLLFLCHHLHPFTNGATPGVDSSSL